MRQPGRGGRCCPRSLVRGPEVAQVHPGLCSLSSGARRWLRVFPDEDVAAYRRERDAGSVPATSMVYAPPPSPSMVIGPPDGRIRRASTSVPVSLVTARWKAWRVGSAGGHAS